MSTKICHFTFVEPAKAAFTYIYAIIFVLIFLAGTVNCLAEKPLDPADWKMEAHAEKQYSLRAEKWIVDLKFTNVSGKATPLQRGFSEFENDFTARMIRPDGKPGDMVPRREFRSGIGANIRPQLVIPKDTGSQKFDLRWCYIFTKPGVYELKFRRYRDFLDAHNGWIGGKVENVLNAEAIRIIVTE